MVKLKKPEEIKQHFVILHIPSGLYLRTVEGDKTQVFPPLSESDRYGQLDLDPEAFLDDLIRNPQEWKDEFFSINPGLKLKKKKGAFVGTLVRDEFEIVPYETIHISKP